MNLVMARMGRLLDRIKRLNELDPVVTRELLLEITTVLAAVALKVNEMSNNLMEDGEDS